VYVGSVDDVADDVLVDRWQSGDNAAGETLFKRHFDSVYSFFHTKSPADADELTQSTFVECVKAKDKFRRHSSFRTFLFAVARHELYRMFRTRQRRDAKLDFEVSSIADLVTTPGTRLARIEEQQRLIDALQHLPVEQQILLELHYREELGIADLEEVFEVSSQVIRTRLFRARKALREQIETLGREEQMQLAAAGGWAARLTAPD
jgi:RNA polymerase sigma factor (sigma-70 family)